MKIPVSYEQFLSKKKLILNKNQFSNDSQLFLVESFLDFSSNENLNYYKVNSDYEGRIHDGLVIIAKADNGDFILMSKNTEAIHFWNHEINDLGYSDDSSYPAKISDSLEKFINSLQKESQIEFDKEDVVSISKKADFNEKFKKFLKK